MKKREVGTCGVDMGDALASTTERRLDKGTVDESNIARGLFYSAGEPRDGNDGNMLGPRSISF